jgi:hypothetical protein
MKVSKRVILFAGIILGLSSASFALPNIAGNWKCMGQDPMQKKNVVVSGEIKKTGDTYSLVNWKDDESNEARSGTGIHNNKMKDSLAVMFWSNDNSENVAFGLYQIKSANKIVGMWTTKNGKMTAEEICERTKA